MQIATKRIYEPAAAEDGERILTERLWPRGVKKADAAVDWWPRDLAPSAELRTWFSHDVSRWPEFQRRYRAELEGHGELLDELLARVKRGPVTLVYASRDTEHNNTVFLAGYLRELLAGEAEG